MAVITYSCN